MYSFETVSQKESEHSALDKLLFWSLIAFLSSYVFEGPLRYFFVNIQLPNAIYFRDAIYLLSIVFISLRALIKQGRVDIGIAITIYFLMFHFLISSLLGQTFFSQLFAIKVFLPITYGCAIRPIVAARFNQFSAALGFFFIASIIGVFVNIFVQPMPWEGQTYDTAFGVVNTTREWWAGGVRRLPGFARVSFDAAMMIGLTGLATMLLMRSIFSKLLIALLAMTAIVFTTSKGIVLPFLIAVVWISFYRYPLVAGAGRILVAALCFLSIAIPVIVVGGELGYGAHGSAIPALLSSLWERFTWMWPDAFKLLTNPVHYLFGRGLGAIGMPQLFGPDFYHANSADNIFIYIYVNFGVLAVLYLSFPAWIFFLFREKSKPFLIWCMANLMIAYGYGITTNMFEQPFFCCMFGLSYGAAFELLFPTKVSARI